MQGIEMDFGRIYAYPVQGNTINFVFGVGKEVFNGSFSSTDPRALLRQETFRRPEALDRLSDLVNSSSRLKLLPGTRARCRRR